DEAAQINEVARAVGVESVALRCGRGEILDAYPRLIQAAEAPVLDTSCAAVLVLAQLLHEHGFKVALTGQGADECLAGYLWFKLDKAFRLFDVPFLRLRNLGLRAYARLTTPYFPWSQVRSIEHAVGGWNGMLDLWGFSFLSRFRFYSREMQERLGGHL